LVAELNKSIQDRIIRKHRIFSRDAVWYRAEKMLERRRPIGRMQHLLAHISARLDLFALEILSLGAVPSLLQERAIGAARTAAAVNVSQAVCSLVGKKS